jgi:hypothetical protein
MLDMLARPNYFFVSTFGYFSPPPPAPPPLFFGGPWDQNSMLDVVSESIVFYRSLFPFARWIEIPKHLGIGKFQLFFSCFECMIAS